MSIQVYSSLEKPSLYELISDALAQITLILGYFCNKYLHLFKLESNIEIFKFVFNNFSYCNFLKKILK